MDQRIEIEATAWAEFEVLMERNANEGFNRVFKEVWLHWERHGWHHWMPISDARAFQENVRLIIRSWAAIRYSKHRLTQLQNASFSFWVFFHGNYAQPRPLHQAWDGIALHGDHPFWETHFPPCGWGCGCYVSGARSVAGVRRLGGDPDLELPLGWNVPLPQTGLLLGIDWHWEGQRWPTLLQIVEAVANGKVRSHA